MEVTSLEVPGCNESYSMCHRKTSVEAKQLEPFMEIGFTSVEVE